MKLLFDENLSPRLADILEGDYPGSAHVRNIGLRSATDARIWDHARGNGFTIVSKDDDFRQRSFLSGAPPKVVWLHVGNAGTPEIARLLQAGAARLQQFEDEEESSLLIISLDSRAV